MNKPITIDRIDSAIVAVLYSPNKSAQRAALWLRLHDKRAELIKRADPVKWQAGTPNKPFSFSNKKPITDHWSDIRRFDCLIHYLLSTHKDPK